MMYENIIRMMRESGLKVHDTSPPDAIERFVALVAVAEREACAKVCDGWAKYGIPAAASCASEIRARGEK